MSRRRWTDGALCVRGLKLTGDDNVPCGKTSFQFSLGAESIAEDEISALVVITDVASLRQYVSQGLIADSGQVNLRHIAAVLSFYDNPDGFAVTFLDLHHTLFFWGCNKKTTTSTKKKPSETEQMNKWFR